MVTQAGMSSKAEVVEGVGFTYVRSKIEGSSQGVLKHESRCRSRSLNTIAFKMNGSIPSVGFQQAWDKMKMSTLTRFLL